jgi:signal peptidase I
MKFPVNRRRVPAATLATIAICVSGYYLGGWTARRTPGVDDVAVETGFRIVGDSMAPTFWPGEICHARPHHSTLRIGDVVAISFDGQPRIKRIAAVGGDVVDLAEGRLLVNGRRLEDVIADRVDDDFVRPAWVPVESGQDDWTHPPSAPDWIVYAHHNSHQAGRVTPIEDDYPFNHSVRRILHRVDRLVIGIRDASPEQSTAEVPPFKVVFFDHRHSIVSTTTRNGDARFRDARPVTENDATASTPPTEVIDAAHPIAVRIDPFQRSRYTLHIYREIEYRDDKRDGTVDYPVQLPNDEVFVVGDNVPVSVDSRHVGPLKAADIHQVLTKQFGHPNR